MPGVEIGMTETKLRSSSFCVGGKRWHFAIATELDAKAETEKDKGALTPVTRILWQGTDVNIKINNGTLKGLMETRDEVISAWDILGVPIPFEKWSTTEPSMPQIP